MLYAAYMYFQGLSLRAVSACLDDLCLRSHVSIWRWVQRFSQLNALFTVGHVRCFLVDETWIKVGSQEAWLWLAFEPYGRFFLGLEHRVYDVARGNLMERFARYMKESD
jgi:transposase-like protein